MKSKYYTSFILLTLVACASGAESIVESSVSKMFKTEINVYISNGKQQCENNALPITVTKSYLVDAGIGISAQSCGILNGVMYASVCGGASGQVHIFTIDKNDLDKAKAIGFDDLSNTPNGIMPVDCRSFYSPRFKSRY